MLVFKALMLTGCSWWYFVSQILLQVFSSQHQIVMLKVCTLFFFNSFLTFLFWKYLFCIYFIKSAIQFCYLNQTVKYISNVLFSILLCFENVFLLFTSHSFSFSFSFFLFFFKFFEVWKLLDNDKAVVNFYPIAFSLVWYQRKQSSSCVTELLMLFCIWLLY